VDRGAWNTGAAGPLRTVMSTQRKSAINAGAQRVSQRRAAGAEPDGPKSPLPLHPQARKIARAGFAIALVALALWIARDFLAALAWAAILAIALWPLYTRLVRVAATGRPPLVAPLLFTLLTGFVLFTPLVLATQEIARESEQIMSWITSLRETGVPVPAWVAQLPIAGEQLERWWHANLTDPKRAGSWFQNLDMTSAVEWGQALGGQLLHRMAMFFIALMALFALLRHGAWVGGRVLESADRLLGDPGERLASKMIDAVRGTVTGTVVVAVAEGLLIGLGYIIAGVPNPVLYTLLTIAFAMIPLGAWIAFSTAAVVLLLHGGSGWAAAGILGWGAAVMLIGDHFAWPTLVGGAARLPFLVALVGIFGGLQSFGLVGLFLGPVIMAALLTIWREWLMVPARR
jgi:predicted PurR-regulated permease PerM